MAKKKVSTSVTKPSKTVEIKSEAVQPKMIKKEEGEEVVSGTKRSVIVYKKEEKLENLYQALGEVERTIQELTRLYAETPDSSHMGVGGMLKPTEKQIVIKEQLDRANEIPDRLMKLIEAEENNK